MATRSTRITIAGYRIWINIYRLGLVVFDRRPVAKTFYALRVEAADFEGGGAGVASRYGDGSRLWCILWPAHTEWNMGQEKYNIFISYAWVDNKPSGAGAHAWVSTFVDRIGKHLARDLPRQYAGDGVWLDYERLRGSDPLKTSIRAKLEASRILVPIISPGYLDSRWCRDELKTFLELHGDDSGRIFPVWMSPTDNLPAPLDDLVKVQILV